MVAFDSEFVGGAMHLLKPAVLYTDSHREEYLVSSVDYMCIGVAASRDSEALCASMDLQPMFWLFPA